MPYIIDGHNLIAKIPGIELDDLEDEKKLIELLQTFLSRENKKAKLFFDRASTGHSRVQSHGRVTAHFINHRETADLAIARQLKRLGAGARNWTVVSSDREVQNYAKSAGAKIIPSQEFANRILNQSPTSNIEREDVKLSEDELDEWREMFGDK